MEAQESVMIRHPLTCDETDVAYVSYSRVDLCSGSMQGVDDRIHEYLSSASKEVGFSAYLVAVLEDETEGSASGSKSKTIDPSALFAVDMNGVPSNLSKISLDLSRDVVNKDQTSAQNPDQGLRSARMPRSCSFLRPIT